VTHTLQQLRELVDQHFNDEKLRHLCFDLGVDYDNLGGRGKAANGRELIALLERQRQLTPSVGSPARPAPGCGPARPAPRARSHRC
jgi:hypothetical protein